MSKQVDERVVSMQFDNAQFEKNVSTTMSTVDKLKQKLQFKDSAKGLENVSSAAKNVNMSGLSGAVENVRAKFSALEVMGVTALANITNSAVNAGKRIVSALTIDPIKTGFKEYETQINAVQTILANTESKGTTIDDVNKALDTLNTYADKTIYNFTEMTRNIGTFTAAGVDLDTSVNAIQGIANLAAVSGSTSQQASTAMYQLSQALASGTVKLMDWNSVVNAGMGGEVFQNALKETARVHGVAIDDMIKKRGSFRETLKDEWLTSEVLTETLSKFTMSTEGATEAEVKANREKLKSLGYTDKQIEEIFKLGNTATNAATKVKTFTQLWDVLKESAQSGWSKTWKLIIGDFEDAKNLLTPIADFLTGILNKFSDWRNNLLEGALTKNFKHLSDKIADLLSPLDKAANAVKKVTTSLGDLNKIADEVIIGKWKVGVERYDDLTEAGYNYYAVQNKVNEKMGNSFRYTDKQIEAQNELLRSQGKLAGSTEGQGKSIKDLTDAEIEQIASLAELSEAELKAMGYSKEQIAVFKELKSISEKLGIPIKDLIKNLDEIDGRWLLINGFKNIGKGIIKVFKAIGDAWREIFPPASSNMLFDIIAGFHKLSTKLVMSDDTADKLKRTFKGLFALLKLVFTLVSGPIKIAFKVLSAILGYFNLDILSVTAYIGDAIVMFTDWIGRVADLRKIVDKVLPSILSFGKGIYDWILGIKDAENIPRYILEGLINGIKSAFSGVWNTIGGFITGIIDYVKNLLGIHSPSTVFIAIGGFIIAGLLTGLANTFPAVMDFFKGIGDSISEVLGSVDWSKVLSAVISLGLVVGLLKLASALSRLAGPLDGFGEVLTSVSKGIKSFSLAMKAEAIKSIAISVLILVGAIAILCLLDTGKMFIAIGGIVILLAALAGMLVVINKMGKGGEVKIAKFAALLLSLAATMVILSIVVKQLGKMSWEELGKAGIGLAGLGLIIVGLIAATKLAAGGDVDRVGRTISKIATAMLIMTIVAKIIAGMSWEDMGKAGVGLAGLGAIIVGLIAATKLAGGSKFDKVGKMISKIATAMLILVIVAKIIAAMSWDDMLKAGVGIAGLGAIVVGLIAATKLIGGGKVDKIGKTISKIATAMLLLALTAKILATMSWDDMLKAGVGLAGLGAIIVGLIAATKLAGGGKKLDKVGKTILLVSFSIGILAAVALLMSLMSWEGIAKGVVAVGALSGMMVALIAVTKRAKKCERLIFALAVVVGVLAASIIALSFVDVGSLIASTASMAAVMGMLVLVINSTKNSKNALKSLLGIAAVIAVMGTVLLLLSTLSSPESVLSSAIALSLLMSVLAGVMIVISKVKKVPASAIVGMAAIGLVVAELAVILGLMSAFNVTPSIETAAALSILLASLTGTLVVLSLIGNTGAGAFIGIAALSVLIVALGAIMVGIGALMDYCPKLEEFLDKGMGVLEKIGYALGSFLGNIVGGLLAGITNGLPDIGTNLSEFMTNAKPFIDGIKGVDATAMSGAQSLAGVVLALTAASVLEGLTSWFTGGTSMTDFAEQLVPFGTAMVEFSSIVSGNIDEGAVTAAANAGKMMTEMAKTIPNSGGVVGWFMGENDLDDFGKKLVPFGKAIVAFSSIVAGKIDENAVLAAANAGKMMTEMADTIPNSGGVVGWFMGENDLDSFGEKLVPFGEAITAFSAKVAGKIDENAVLAAANAGKMMVEMADTIPNSGGVVGFFAGENDLDSFSEKIEPFGAAIVAFSNAVSGNIDTKSIFAAAQIGHMLAAMNNSLPKEGGLVQLFTGETMSMEDFSAGLPLFGAAVKGFADSIKGVELDSGVTSTILNAGLAFAEIQGALPKVGGVVEALKGENMDMDTFGQGIVDFAGHIMTFATNISGMGTIDKTKVDTITNAGLAFASMQEALPTVGGWVSDAVGDEMTLTKFGEHVNAFADAIVTFSDKTKALNPVQLVSLTENISAIFGYMEEMFYKSSMGKYTLADKDIKNALSAYGDALKSFYAVVKDFDGDKINAGIALIDSTVDSYVGIGENFKDVGEVITMLNDAKQAIEDFQNIPIREKNNISMVIGIMTADIVDKLEAAFESLETNMKTTGEELIDSLIEGIGAKSNTTDSKTKCTDLVKACVEAIKKKKEDFKSVGKDLVDGFASGITAQTFKAEAKAKAMAEAAEQAAKDALDINSPSKVFRAIGMSVPEGFAMGIDKLSRVVENSSVSMANGAVDRVRNSISHIADMLNSDIDSQPTIRPVLDLSEVRAGTGALNNMLGTGSSFGIRANVGSISSMMNDRIQNGVGSDIVSAIEDLGRKLNNMSGDSYNINGVTYDDGSNINDAVKTIVRAARVARRV